MTAPCGDGKGGGCGKPVLATQPRVSAHGPLDYGSYFLGNEFTALLKQSGYEPNEEYGTGGTWGVPRVMHLECARRAGARVPDGF